MKKEFVEVKGIVSISGDYCAWHEASVSVQWVYGEYFYYEDMIGEYMCEALDCEWDELEKQDKEKMDKLAKEYVASYESDYTDIENAPVLLEIRNGDVYKVWQ